MSIEFNLAERFCVKSKLILAWLFVAKVMEDMFSRKKLNDTLGGKISLFDWIDQRKHQNYKFKQQNK